MPIDRIQRRPDGHECHGKHGGRLKGCYVEADPDGGNQMQRVCHECHAAKKSSKDVSGKHRAGQRKAEDTGGGAAGLPQRRDRGIFLSFFYDEGSSLLHFFSPQE